MKSEPKRFRRTVVSRAVITAVWGTAAMLTAQDTLAQQASLERVEITGSSIRRTDAETALPVQVISREEIARTGATSTEELLQTITVTSTQGGTQLSTGAGTSTYGVSTLSLRGLGDSRTLVLLNGRRLAPSANDGVAVNINTIPLAAIERVEILKDGASAVYGSDAMAGVVNFILRKSFQGIEVSAGYGTPTDSGGGQNANASITAGFGGQDRWSAVVSASWEKDRALFGRDRPYAATSVNPPFYTSGATGQGNIEGAVVPGAFPNDRVTPFGNSPGTGYGNPAAYGPGGCASIRMFEIGTTTRGQRFCAYDPGPDVGLLPDRDLFTFSANAAFKLGPNMELFADALYSKSETRQTIQPSPLRRSFALSNTRLLSSGVDPSLIVFPTNPNYPTAYLTQFAPTLLGRPIAVTARVFDFGGRQTTDESEQTRLLAGLRGNLTGSHEYEVAAGATENQIAGRTTGGYFSVTDYNRIINSSNWNPWAPGAVQTGALADQLKSAEYRGPTLNASMEQKFVDGTLRGDLMRFGSGTVQYATGFQYRREHLVSDPAPALATGDIAGLGGATPPLDRSRNVGSIFAEVNVPVLRQLELNGSVRHDRYNDVGSTTTYKANLRFQPTPAVVLRSSYGTGFRAPSLYALWDPQVIGTSEQFDDPATGQTDLQVSAISGGNPDLKPETSKQFSAGIVFSPANNFSVGVDFFRYKIEDIIATASTQEIVSRFRAGDAAYAGLVDLSPSGDVDLVRVIPANVGKADVSGFDVFATFRTTLGPGRLDVGINGTYMSKFDQTSPGGQLSRKVGTLVEPDGTPVIGSDTGGVILRWKHALSATYTWNSWSFTLIQRHNSRYRAGNTLLDEPNFIPSVQYYDLNVAFRGFRNLTLALGAKNVFDKQPPGTFTPVSNQFQSGYDAAQYDPRGRFVYVKATYRFR